MKNTLIALLLAASTVSFMAQAAVYQSEEDGVPTFSDQPTPGARPLELPPPNVIQDEPPAEAFTPAPDNDAAPPYNSLVITSPADQDSVYTNTGAFEAKVQVDPPLRIDRGDTIRLKLDGVLLPQSYTSADVSITDTDWQSAASADTTEHTLAAAILDSQGKLLIESAPVRFYAHRATVKRVIR